MENELGKVLLARRAWYVPSEDDASRGWLEGRPNAKQIAISAAGLRKARQTWHPTPQAWDQLNQMQQFAGKRIRVRFWDAAMNLLEESEWPDWIEAWCEGTATLLDQSHLQAFLIVQYPINARTREVSTSSSLVDRGAINCKLAPLADLHAVELVEVSIDRQ